MENNIKCLALVKKQPLGFVTLIRRNANISETKLYFKTKVRFEMSNLDYVKIHYFKIENRRGVFFTNTKCLNLTPSIIKDAK